MYAVFVLTWTWSCCFLCRWTF